MLLDDTAAKRSLITTAIMVLLVIGQGLLASHVVADTLAGIDDNCEICSQLERQQVFVNVDPAPELAESLPEFIPPRLVAPALATAVMQPRMRGPPVI